MSDAVRSFAPNLLAGKVVVITGGGTGIGLELARAMSTLGAKLVIASRKTERIEAAADRSEEPFTREGWFEVPHAPKVATYERSRNQCKVLSG